MLIVSTSTTSFGKLFHIFIAVQIAVDHDCGFNVKCGLELCREDALSSERLVIFHGNY